MYHIANDLRAKKSAELICQGLEDCLKEKPLNKIRVIDIYNKCYVSRATFYRLFDSINDVLAYECDIIREDALKAKEAMKFKNKNEEVLFSINRWLKHEELIKAIIDNKLIGILYESHIRNYEKIKKLYSLYYEDEKQFIYFVTILVSLVFASLTIYFDKNKTEPMEKVFEFVCLNADRIVSNWKTGLPQQIKIE